MNFTHFEKNNGRHTLTSEVTPKGSGGNFVPSEPEIDALLDIFVKKMDQEKIDKSVIAAFSNYYRELHSGEQGLIPEEKIHPIGLGEITHLSELSSYKRTGDRLLPHTVMIKLNGGLGTTLGCNGPKSLLPVKGNHRFIDISVRQALHLRKRFGTVFPLLLMNSFNTHELTEEALANYPELSAELPLTFLQHKFPKILESSLLPASFPEAPRLEWNPPGHGDFFTSLATSGILRRLIEKKFRYAFVSNIDNLGTSLDPSILGYMAEKSIEFLMEVTDRTSMDRKGGHIARLHTGQLVLRESCQCPEQDRHFFTDVNRHQFFNTNNLWINLEAMQTKLDQNHGHLELPMICNRKYLDPTDPASPPVFQLESAIGSALSIFDSAAVVHVPRSRFMPVKSGEDLLLIRSDCFMLTDDFRIVPITEAGASLPVISLDHTFYSTVEQLSERFPFGVPSLRWCTHLTIKGDVSFGRNVKIVGNVTISNATNRRFHIPDSQLIDRDLIASTL